MDRGEAIFEVAHLPRFVGLVLDIVLLLCLHGIDHFGRLPQVVVVHVIEMVDEVLEGLFSLLVQVQSS